MVTTSDLNPFSKVSFGLGGVWDYIVLGIIVLVIMALIGVLTFVIVNGRKYKYRIPLYSTIGNVVTELKTFKACDYPVGRAGDKLWFVKGAKKFIPPAMYQSKPNYFPHYLTEDGEWINFQHTDLNLEKKRLNLKFNQRDMALARLSTDKLLEQRLMQKGFWEKWGVVVGYVIFFLIITVCLVIFIYQLSGVVQGLGSVTARLDDMMGKYENIVKPTNSLVPATNLVLGVMKSWVL